MFLVLFASLYCLCFCMYVLFDVPYGLFCVCDDVLFVVVIVPVVLKLVVPNDI